ncbi:tumor necrosis factor receptor superfamily member 4 isoform X2 [Colius striatus]|nr:tumor necrosis factor receptor superfamily member 4 isoform X2 [Colius striatus]
MKDRCTAKTDTVCVPCQDGYFSSEHNHRFCKSCTFCNTRDGSVEVKKCEKTSDRICQCIPGYMPDVNYPLGSMCLKCPEGFYSTGGNEKCQPWTNCSMLGKSILQPGTTTKDVVCSNHITQPATSQSATTLNLSTTAPGNNRSTAVLSPSRPGVIPFICPDTKNPTQTNWGSLSLILICLVLLVVSGMSILLLVIQAAKRQTKRRPHQNNHQAQEMTQQTNGVGHLRVRSCLLLVVCLWQWTQTTLATACQDGELRVIWKDHKKCCPKCKSSTGDDGMCQNIEDHECKCRAGYSCIDSACLYCTKLPECAEGEELVKLGNFDFIFKCKPCEIGTYSNVKNGWCRNWTDCENSGFLTIKQGNSTHNAVCGFPPKDVEQVPVTNDSLYTVILAILTAVAVFVLILLTFFLHFCIWSLKKEKHPAAEDLEHNKLLVALQPSHHREETSSCQFPEEEHGDKIPEEKSSYFHPQSLQ